MNGSSLFSTDADIDSSAGYCYSENDVIYVDDGQEIEVNGRSFIGPMKIITECKLLYLS